MRPGVTLLLVVESHTGEEREGGALLEFLAARAPLLDPTPCMRCLVGASYHSVFQRA